MTAIADLLTHETQPRDLADQSGESLHGIVLLRAGAVESRDSRPWPKDPSTFLAAFDGIPQCQNGKGTVRWLREADWDLLRTPTPETPERSASGA